MTLAVLITVGHTLPPAATKSRALTRARTRGQVGRDSSTPGTKGVTGIIHATHKGREGRRPPLWHPAGKKRRRKTSRFAAESPEHETRFAPCAGVPARRLRGGERGSRVAEYAPPVSKMADCEAPVPTSSQRRSEKHVGTTTARAIPSAPEAVLRSTLRGPQMTTRAPHELF